MGNVHIQCYNDLHRIISKSNSTVVYWQAGKSGNCRHIQVASRESQPSLHVH